MKARSRFALAFGLAASALLVALALVVHLSLAGVEPDPAARRGTLLLALLLALAATAGVAVVLGRVLARPIEAFGAALARVDDDTTPALPTSGDDDLARIAAHCERLSARFRQERAELRRERDKLATVARGLDEGLVVTAGDGTVVLVNAAAEALLGKTAEQISAAGLEHLLDTPDTLRRLLDGTLPAPYTLDYRDRMLELRATTITDADGRRLGSAALLRDVTEQKRHEELLRVQLASDALTGLHNRRHLDATLAVEFHRSVRTGTALSVLVLDVDRFAEFNARHGSDQGDRALQRIACKMRAALRKYDTACRLDGEEFVAILPNAGSEEACHVAERLRADIAATAAGERPVTVSIGIASTPEVIVDTPEALLAAAVAVLAAAKVAGRDRTQVASA